MKIIADQSLRNYNTFQIDAKASKFVEFSNLSDLSILSNTLKDYDNYLILGGGSNILLTKDFDGLVIHNAIKGIEVIKETSDFVWVKAMAGENWHEFVMYSVKNNYGGIENLSLIPGYVGAAPMQNIGAYGVELREVFEVLEAYHIEKKQLHLFDKEDCKFGYRDSIFKNEVKDQYIILSVTLRLTKKHRINSEYGIIQNKLDERGISEPTIKNISDVVIDIRSSKLPDPKVLGNSGSFFKNPIVGLERANSIHNEFENMPRYQIDKNNVKIPAGWLIEQCGWKGKIVGNTGTYKKQALVIVNHGNASGGEILDLSKKIQSSVKEKFDIDLIPEVNII